MRALILVAALAACTAEPAKQDTPPAETPAAEVSADTTQANLARMPNWETARSTGVDFRAVGQEPGWIVDVYTQDRIVALIDYGEIFVEFPRNEPTYPAEGATRYETQANGHTLSITVRRAPCEDVMSGEAYPSTVQIVFDGRTLDGCGRSA